LGNGAADKATLVGINVDGTKSDKKSDEAEKKIARCTEGKKRSNDSCDERQDHEKKLWPGRAHYDDTRQQWCEQEQETE
jgi:hypothetical protein